MAITTMRRACCGGRRDNMIGVQFQPGKSQAYGINFLKRFMEWAP